MGELGLPKFSSAPGFPSEPDPECADDAWLHAPTCNFKMIAEAVALGEVERVAVLFKRSLLRAWRRTVLAA